MPKLRPKAPAQGGQAKPPDPPKALTERGKRLRAGAKAQPSETPLSDLGHAPTTAPAVAKLFGRLASALEMDWHSRARASQLPPEGDWRIWLLLAGRGFGKTRSGAEWVREQVESGAAKRVAIICPTAGDCRDVAAEGASGILAVSPDWCRPTYLPSKRRIEWPNGAIATLYSADEPDRLRGPQHDAAWCDELAAWRYPEAWDQLQFGLRLGTNPRCVVTTTPKPVRLIRELLGREGKDVVITRGKTEENRSNLAPQFLDAITARYIGTRLGRQELDAELLEDVPGALWARDTIDRARVAAHPDLARVVVAIDPAGSNSENADETGIIVAGTDGKGQGFVLDDLSGRYSPTEWARKAIGAYKRYQADRIIAETNFGGQMVEATLRAVDRSIAFKAITASRGKVLRAEPVAAMFDQGCVHHVGAFPGLEDQMCGFASDFNRQTAGYSPDRVDALCFALTELLMTGNARAYLDFLEEDVARAQGKELPHRLGMANPPPLEAPQPPTITMRAPAPHQRFAPAKGVQYEADASALVVCDPQFVEAMIDLGCRRKQGEQ